MRDTVCKRILLINILLFSFLQPMDAQEAKQQDTEQVAFSEIDRQLGDAYLQLDIGIIVPMFFTGLDGEFWYATGFFSVGPKLGLELGAYVHPHIRIGIHLDGSFSISKADFFMLQYVATVRTTYTFRIKKAEIPVYVDLGINVSTYDKNSHADFILRFGSGFLWNFNNSWAFGCFVTYTFIPQTYYGAGPSRSESRLGNFFEALLSVKYTF